MWVLRALCSWPRAQRLSLAFSEHYQPPGHPAPEICGSSFLHVSQDPFELCFRPLTLPSSGLDPYLHPVTAWLTRRGHPFSESSSHPLLHLRVPRPTPLGISPLEGPPSPPWNVLPLRIPCPQLSNLYF